MRAVKVSKKIDLVMIKIIGDFFNMSKEEIEECKKLESDLRESHGGAIIGKIEKEVN